MSYQNTIHEKYRPEIDGLRAFAVIAVIINHFNKDILQSGYLGVDIFFVISGFVITASVAGRKNTNFSDFIIGFYERRIKRLIPSLVFFVLITSVIISFFRPDSSTSINTGLSSLFGLSNVIFFLKSKDYFAHSQLLNPFTHTWSLGVEIQFYIIFPFLIWFTGFGLKTSKGSRNLFILVLFLAICSLIPFIYLYSTNQAAAYFLMPTRFWEIASGCLMFLFSQKNGVVFKKVESASPLVVLLAMTGVLFFPESFAVPSTITIVLLSLVLISCLRKGTLVFNFLTKYVIVHIGLISYSLYLWHWGVLSISRSTIGIHWWSIPFQITFIYLLAFVSYRWIESPLRRKDWSFDRWKTILKGILTLIFSAIFLFFIGKPLKGKLYLGDPLLVLNDPYYSLITNEGFCRHDNKELDKNGKIKFLQCFNKNKKSKQTLFFLGDSHNSALLLGSEFISNQTNSDLAYAHIEIFPSDEINKVIKSSTYNKIISNSKKDDIVFITIRMTSRFLPDWYEIVGSRRENDFKDWLYFLGEFVEVLSEKQIKVIISTPTPEFEHAKFEQCKGQNHQWFNKLNKKDCAYNLDFFSSKNGRYSYIIEKLNEVTSEHENLYLFDALNVMCPNKKCNYILGDKILYRDDDHLSNYAARYILAPEMLKFIKEQKILNMD